MQFVTQIDLIFYLNKKKNAISILWHTPKENIQ